jgi:ABC-type amino acid transport substrate-binding protein
MFIMKKLTALVMALCIVLAAGCKEEEAAQTQTDYPTLSVGADATDYHVAFRPDDAALMGEVMDAYLYRYAEGVLLDSAPRYFNPGYLTPPDENADYHGDDGSFDAVKEKGTLVIGVVRNPALAYSGEDDSGSVGYFSAAGKLIAMRLKVAPEITLFDDSPEAVRVLTDGEIDCIIGIPQSADPGLSYSYPIARG